MDRAVDRTVLGVNVVRPFCRGVLIGLQPKVVGHVNAAHDQDSAVLFDLARGFRREEALACWDLARFQRTTKGARQSAGRGSDEIVERRIARLVDLRVNPIMLGHRRVDAEMDWVGPDGEEGAAVRTLPAFDPHLRTIHHWISHDRPPSRRVGQRGLRRPRLGTATPPSLRRGEDDARKARIAQAGTS